MFSQSTLTTQLSKLTQPSETSALLSSVHPPYPHRSASSGTESTSKGRFGVIECPSSRRVSYMEHGARGGVIVFYFAASNLNHRACPDSTGVLERLNVRLITVDRPGYGQSTLSKGFNDSPLLFAQNTFGHILGHFGCTAKGTKPYLMGHQTGCIYLLSIAHLHSSAVEDMALICPPTPFRDGPTAESLSQSDSAMRQCSLYCLCCVFCCHYRPTVRRHFVSAQSYLEFVEQSADTEDSKVLRRHKARITDSYEAAEDRVWTEWFVFLSKRWGFTMSSISTHCHLWYGTEDVMAPYSSWYEEALCNVTAHRVEGYGHLLLYPKFDEIIASMIHCDL